VKRQRLSHSTHRDNTLAGILENTKDFGSFNDGNISDNKWPVASAALQIKLDREPGCIRNWNSKWIEEQADVTMPCQEPLPPCPEDSLCRKCGGCVEVLSAAERRNLHSYVGMLMDVVRYLQHVIKFKGDRSEFPLLLVSVPRTRASANDPLCYQSFAGFLNNISFSPLDMCIWYAKVLPLRSADTSENDVFASSFIARLTYKAVEQKRVPHIQTLHRFAYSLCARGCDSVKFALVIRPAYKPVTLSSVQVEAHAVQFCTVFQSTLTTAITAAKKPTREAEHNTVMDALRLLRASSKPATTQSKHGQSESGDNRLYDDIYGQRCEKKLTPITAGPSTSRPSNMNSTTSASHMHGQAASSSSSSSSSGWASVGTCFIFMLFVYLLGVDLEI
jgi:hypothetical protein